MGMEARVTANWVEARAAEIERLRAWGSHDAAQALERRLQGMVLWAIAEDKCDEPRRCAVWAGKFAQPWAWRQPGGWW